MWGKLRNVTWIFLVFFACVCVADTSSLTVPNQRVANFPKNFRQKLGPIFPKNRQEIIAARKLKESDPLENEADIFKPTAKFADVNKRVNSENFDPNVRSTAPDKFNPSVKSDNARRSDTDNLKSTEVGAVRKSDKDCDDVKKFDDTDPRSLRNQATFYGGLDLSPPYPEYGQKPPAPQGYYPTPNPLPNPIPTAGNPYSSSIPTGPTVFPMPNPTSGSISGNYYKPTGMYPIPNPTSGSEYYKPPAPQPTGTFPIPNPTPGFEFPTPSATFGTTESPSFPTVDFVTGPRPPPTQPVDPTDLGTFPPDTIDTVHPIEISPPGTSPTVVPILGLSAVRKAPTNTDRVSAIRNVAPNNRDISNESDFPNNRGRNSENRNEAPRNRDANSSPTNRDRNVDRNASNRESSDRENSNPETLNRESPNREASNRGNSNRETSNRETPNRERQSPNREASNPENSNRETPNRERQSPNREAPNPENSNRETPNRETPNRERQSPNREASNRESSNRENFNREDSNPGTSNRDASQMNRDDRKANARSLFGAPSRRTPVAGANSPQRRLVGDTNENENLRENAREREHVKDLEEDPAVIKDFMFSEIKCFRTRQKEYFGAKVHLKGGFHLPYIRDRPQDSLTSSECHLERTEDPNSYHMKISDLRSCGVEQCGDQAMCLTLVFPRVPTLALADDEVTTIKCTPQKSTMTETRTISFAGDSLDTRRSSSTVNGGGQEFAAEVGIFRQNPGTKNGLFVKRVNSGGVVQLGEPLQLRSVVRGGDGWTFSKLTDVKVWRMRDSYSHTSERLNPNDASEVITLVDPHGCRNQEFRVISEAHPLRDPRNDLVHHFNFKAFLFRGQRSNEPLIVTAKVQACQDRDDCETRDCTSSISARLDDDHDGERFKRSPAEIKNSSSIIHDWNSQMSLRVVGFTDDPSTITEEDFLKGSDIGDEGRSFVSYSCKEKIIGSALGASFVMLLLCSLAFTLITFCLRTRKIRQNRMESESPENLNSSNWTLKRSSSFPSLTKINERCPRRNANTNTATKPLPAPPLKSPEKLSKSDVSKLLYQLSSQGHSPEPAEYESIPGEVDEENNNSKEDGVYVVYCCKKNGKRSRSAPASLRDKKRLHGRSMSVEEDTDQNDVEKSSEESDDSFVNENMRAGPGRITVRSVKRNSQHQQHQRNNKRLVSNKDGGQRLSQAGSFPRVICKRVPGGGAGTRSYRGKKHVNFAETYLRDDISTQLSSEDSAYSGSVSSRFTTTSSIFDGKCKHPKTGYLKEIQSSITATLPDDDRFQNAVQRLNSEIPANTSKHPICNKSMTHFVTRNDKSTQIIIIPETNV